MLNRKTRFSLVFLKYLDLGKDHQETPVPSKNLSPQPPKEQGPEHPLQTDQIGQTDSICDLSPSHRVAL